MLVESISLHADGQLQKSATYSEVTCNNTYLSQGLMNGQVCSGCKDTAVSHDCTVTCGQCNKLFHILCTYQEVSYDNACALRENPCLWWICLPCLAAYDGHNQNPPSKGDDDLDKRICEKVKNALDSFKIDILDAIDTKFQNNTPQINEPSSKSVKRKLDQPDSSVAGRPKVPRTTVTADEDVVVIDEAPPVTFQPKGNYASALKTNSSESENKLLQLGTKNSHSPRKSKHLLHFRPIIDKRIILKTDEWYQLRRTISERLANIKVSFSHFNPKTGKVVLGFPNEHCKNFAIAALKDVPELWCFEQFTPEKMLPKLTIHNVPLDFNMPPTSSNDQAENSNVFAQRDLVKDQIWKTIVDKNDGVRSLIEGGSSLDVVYFKQHKYTATVAIKVSPDIRLHILEKCDAKLYLFSGSCRASDRCHYQQCFHCLKFGHIFKECPRANNPPNCKYCTEAHDSRSCSIKDLIGQHKCVNCKHSKSPTVSGAYNTHNATSKDCPTAVSIVNRIHKNTLFEVPSATSKNE